MSMIKRIYRYNYFGQRDAMINEYMVEATCLRCDLIETQEHVLHYNENKKGRLEFAKNLIKTLFKKKSKEVKEDEVMSFTEDIMKYARDDENGEYKSSQQYIGMRELFRRYAVKDWSRVEFSMNKYHKLNRIVTKKCVEYCIRCWKERNVEYNDEIKQRK